MIQFIKNKIRAFVLKNASANKMIDIVEVRTKEIGLTQVTTETDIRITNSFLLPITIVSIATDLLNRDGLKIGKMNYDHPQKIKRKSDEVLTTTSQISIITSLFQALSTLLLQDINMRSVGVARIKILWFIFEIPIDDTFIIHPKKVKIIKDLTEEEIKQRAEEKLIRAQDKEINDVLKEQDKETRNIEKALKYTERKERILQRRYKENYISKADRLAQKNQKRQTPENLPEEIDVILNEKAILQMASDTTDTNSLGNI